MESVETRKLGKHLFIFEKGKDRNGNGKARDRTLITSCETEDGDNKLPPEFVKYMRTLFDILDEKNTGFVKLIDLEACWSKNNGDSSSHGTGVLEQLRRVTPANGLISFDLLCTGFGQALHSNEGVSIRNGSTGQNPELKPASRKNGFVFNQTLVEQRSAVPAVAQVNKQQDTIRLPVVPGKFVEFSKSNEIRERTVPKSEKGLNHKPSREQKRPKSMGHKTNKPKKSVHWSSAVNESYRYGVERRSRPISLGSFGQPHEETTHLYPSQTNSHISSKNGQNPEHELCKTDAVCIPKPEARRRPRSMVHFGEQKRVVDLSVAKKEGGILEGLQKTDKKAVIDKLKQWRNEELKKGGQGRSDVRKEPGRVAHGYQSDNEGNRIMRHKSAVAPLCHSGNEPDFGM